MPTPPLISIRKIRVEREAPILRGIDWEVQPGQHWALLGANGSGKTTLLQTLTAFIQPTSGSLEINGQTFGHANWNEIRERITVVSTALLQRIEADETALSVVISGRYDMINFWGRPTKQDMIDGKRLIRQVGLTKQMDRDWAYLSQGERQRALIARALIAKPTLLFLDEPAAGLDPVARDAFLAMLERLCQQPDGPAIVLVTHHVEEIVPSISHVLLLKNGKVQAAGEKKRVLNSANLSATFGAKLALCSRAGRYQLTLKSGSKLFG